MLFDAPTLDGLADGSVDLAFRRWRVPRMRVGSRQRTRVAVVEVTSLAVVDAAEVSTADARRAGHLDGASLLARVGDRDGELYRIGLRVAGADPRIGLRATSQFSDDERAELGRRLARMDAAADRPWTTAALTCIRDAPGVRAADLATGLGQPRDLFKRRVRRLKEFGLTESLEVGYRLSPRGQAFLSSR